MCLINFVSNLVSVAMLLLHIILRHLEQGVENRRVIVMLHVGSTQRDSPGL